MTAVAAPGHFVEVRHRTRGRAETHVNGGLSVAPATVAELLQHPDAPALIEMFDGLTDPDFPQRVEHVELVTALVLRLRLTANERSRGAA